MLQLINELRRAALLGQHETIGKQVASLNDQFASHERDGARKLQLVQLEMQAALLELETSYYSSTYRYACAGDEGARFSLHRDRGRW